MENVLIFGGTGFIGLSLAAHLKQKGMHPIVIGRNQPKNKIDFQYEHWDALSVGLWKTLLENSKAIVNLAGKSVDCIKTPDNCDVILRSRIDATKTIGNALKEVANPPSVWIQMSTAHIYGDPPRQICTEDSAFGYGLAPFVAKAWEDTFNQSKPKNIRGVILRTSFVIGKNGGALSSLKRIVKLGLGGTVGSGKQGMSWIHEYDMNEIINQSIINKKYNGAYIASAPNPVSNKLFMQSLRNKLGVMIGLSAPEFITRIGAHYIFRTDPALALYGRYVMPEKLEQIGFKFKYPKLDEALSNLINKK